MGLLRKKCEFCREKIEKGNEIFRNVKIPGFIGTRQKAFCCHEHANAYEQETRDYLKKSKCGKSCCG